MARKRKHPEPSNHDRWLLSYADFITLLFALFVVLFAASHSDQKRAGRRVAQSVQVAFQHLAAFKPSSKVVPLYDEDGLATDSKNIIGNAHAPFDKVIVNPIDMPGNGGTVMSAVKAKLEGMLKDELTSKSIHLSEDSRGLTISLAESGFFDPGSVVMQSQALAAVDRIAGILQPLEFNIRVEGHTDNAPIHTAQFPSNWELSTARATFLLQYLISKGSIHPTRLSAAGYGEYRPVASNTTAEGRASNRRVDLVVLGSLAQKLEPIQPSSK